MLLVVVVVSVVDVFVVVSVVDVVISTVDVVVSVVDVVVVHRGVNGVTNVANYLKLLKYI